MHSKTAMAAFLMVLITGPLLAPAAQAGERRDGHRADRVGNHVVIDERRHDGMHKVHGKRRHDRRDHRRGHWVGRGHGYGRSDRHWNPRWRARGHRHHHRSYRHRGHQRPSWYGYGLSFELDGIRYHFGERHRR